MKRTSNIAVLVLSLAAFAASAQDTTQWKPSTSKLFSKADSLQLKALNLADTLPNPQHQLSKWNSRKDTLAASLNPTGRLATVNQRTDSVKEQANEALQQARNTQAALDTLRQRLGNKIDSLSRQPNPDRLLLARLDSLRSGLDSLSLKNWVADAQGLPGKAAQVQDSVNHKIMAWQQKVSSKLEGFNQHGADLGINLPSVSLPHVGSGLPNLSPNIGLPSLGVNPDLDINLPAINQAGATLPGSVNMPQVNSPDLSLPGLGDTGKKLGAVNDVSGQVKGYTEGARELASGNVEKMEQLPKNLEQQVMESDAMEAAQKEMTEGINYAEMVQKWNSDPDYARELALNKAKEEAVNHFAGHEEELKAAMQQLGKLKAKKSDAEGVVDLFKPRQNDLKGKPFRERLLPGLSLQFQNSTNQWFDFNFYLGYRISGRITAGAGWVERISENLKEWEYHPEERAYGPRVFAEIKVKRGFHLRGEVEYLNAQVLSPYLNQQDVSGRAWVWSYFGGIKQSFDLSKKLRGNVHLMYNLYNPEKRSPYVSRLNVRVGIELPYRKKIVDHSTDKK
jgi:hypothetical protein